jgi:hypothetical protein
VPCGENPAILRVDLPDPLRLTFGAAHGAVCYAGLREVGVEAGRVEIHRIQVEVPPAVDASALRRRAERNLANAALNRAAGEDGRDPVLRDKRHSLYTTAEFGLVVRHLLRGEVVLLGPVYVAGRALVPADVPVTIADGFLAAEGGVARGGRHRLFRLAWHEVR